MINATFLTCISDLCRSRRIAAIASSTLDAWRAAIESIERVGGSEAECRAAVVLAFAIDPDLDKVRVSLGEDVAKLVTDLTPPVAKRDLNGRATYWVDKVRQGGGCEKAAIALLAAEVPLLLNQDDARTLNDHLGALAMQSSLAEAIRQEAILLKSQALSENAGVNTLSSSKKSLILSMSIDIAGSTEAKTRMVALASDDQRRLGLYEQFYRTFLSHENGFYRSLFASSGTPGAALDWRRLFVVKGIGDELWILYDLGAINNEQILAESVRLLDAGLSLLENSIAWHGTDRFPDVGATFEDEAKQRFDGMNLPYKLHVDLITDALEISGIRSQEVIANVRNYLGHDGPHMDADAVELSNRLNAGQIDLLGRHLRRVFRTDYIGHEVDRFFRTTKFALPGILTVGESLFNRLSPTSKLVAHPGLFRADLTYRPNPSNAMAHFFWHILYAQREIPASDLKGIGYCYRVYYFTREQQLNNLWNRGEEDPFAKQIFPKFPLPLQEQLKSVSRRNQADTTKQ